MLSTADALGCLPPLKESLSWLPLDIAAEAIVEIAISQRSGNSDSEDDDGHEDLCPVYHLVNTSQYPTWGDLLRWLLFTRGPEGAFEIIEPCVGLEKLEALESYPAKNLLGLSRKAYGQEQLRRKPRSVSRVRCSVFREQRGCRLQ